MGESLEEFIERTIDDSFEIQLASTKVEKYIKIGAKWQQERSYGQKEVLELLYNREQYLIETVGEFYKSNIEWFEQFKKK